MMTMIVIQWPSSSAVLGCW